MTEAETWWDGVPCEARRCDVLVLDPAPGRVARVWYGELVGTEQPAVEVVIPEGTTWRGQPGDRIYVHDGDGWGWAKVTGKRGHRGVVSGLFHRVRVLAYV